VSKITVKKYSKNSRFTLQNYSQNQAFQVHYNVTMAKEPVALTLPVEQQLADALALVNLLSLKLDSTAKERDHYKGQYQWLRERLGLMSKKAYGSSSERTTPSQESLFDEAEALVFASTGQEIPEPSPETLPRRVKKPRGSSLTQIADLPVQEERLELPETERHCEHCQHDLHEIGTEILSSKLEIIPAKFFVRRVLQVKYGCRHCAKCDITRPPVVAPLPATAFPGSMASASAVAHIVSQKFEQGVPFHRQEQHLNSLGLDISRQTMANWIIGAGKSLNPLYCHMHAFLVQQPVLHADETVVQVLREADRKAQTKSRMWVYCTGGEGPPLVLYEYQPTRGHQHPAEFLQGFNGYLHVDGYEAYEKLPQVTLAGCWAHARRKFEEAIKVLPADAQKKGCTPAHLGMSYCNRLFAIERDLKEMAPSQRYEQRLKLSASVVAAFKTWLQAQGPTITPKSLLGKAVAYCLNQWEKLTSFLLDGRIEIDNNRIERAIKPFVIGRKNWLFCNTPGGADASALMYSLIESAKLNGLVPLAYITYLLQELPRLDVKDRAALDALLPWSSAMQSQCSKAAVKAAAQAAAKTTAQAK
jgi:transposase